MVHSFEYVKKLFETIQKTPKLDINYCIVFVYNSPETMNDSIHTSECILSEELLMICSSFQRIAEVVYSIDGEEQFMLQIKSIKEKHTYVMVYSMAQNLNGNGRRSLIPLLCEYYNLINIGADFMSCTLGRSKQLMFNLLKEKQNIFPKTYYLTKNDSIEKVIPYISSGKWLLKPDNESSSIGIEIHVFDDYDICKITKILEEYRRMHSIFCVQEYIEGEEVAVPILKIQNSYYCPGISQVDFPKGINHISYDMIMLESYGFSEYKGPLKDKLIETASQISEKLSLTAMSRIDFRIRNDIPYVEDIGANPTISESNGVNMLYCNYLNSDSWCVYAVLVYAALINFGLFKPPFHHSPNNRFYI